MRTLLKREIYKSNQRKDFITFRSLMEMKLRNTEKDWASNLNKNSKVIWNTKKQAIQQDQTFIKEDM